MPELPPPPMSNEEFAEQMRPLAEALSGWAASWASQSEVHGFVASAGSVAMGELAAESQWSAPAWLEPVRNAHSYGHTICYVLAEHVAALAAIIQHASVGPAFSYMPTVRAIFEAIPIAHCLLDPRISVETRIKRSIAYRLRSANQVGGLKGVPGATEDSIDTRRACTEYSDRHGWSIHANGVGGEVLPNAKDDFSKVAVGRRDERLDGVVWSVTSATQHSVWYSLAAAFSDGITVTDPFDTRGGLAPIVVQGGTIAAYSSMCWRGCTAVADARQTLMGWTPSPGMSEHAEVIRREHRRLTASS
jgi:hypothetical protein